MTHINELMNHLMQAVFRQPYGYDEFSLMRTGQGASIQSGCYSSRDSRNNYDDEHSRTEQVFAEHTIFYNASVNDT